jgi:hypothetical protein
MTGGRKITASNRFIGCQLQNPDWLVGRKMRATQSARMAKEVRILRAFTTYGSNAIAVGWII